MIIRSAPRPSEETIMPTLTRLNEIEQAFSRKALRRICEADERSFGDAYGMELVTIPDRKRPDNFYFYKDNGSNVLAVAHLDTVAWHGDRKCRFVVTEGAGTVVFSRALDDRLGAYVILELLPLLGLKYDVLLTVGEESGQSTAEFFDPPKDKHYDYMIEFDRGGTDVVMYQYDDLEVRDLVKASGARVGDGSFSDISYLGHLGIKGFNWGVGYQDYHGPRAHAFLDDTFAMVARYLNFAAQNEGVYMPHYQRPDEGMFSYGRSWSQRNWEDDWDDEDIAIRHPDDIDDDLLSDIDRGDDPDYDEYPSLAALERIVGNTA
jgi:hypothetical protein